MQLRRSLRIYGQALRPGIPSGGDPAPRPDACALLAALCRLPDVVRRRHPARGTVAGSVSVADAYDAAPIRTLGGRLMVPVSRVRLRTLTPAASHPPRGVSRRNGDCL